MAEEWKMGNCCGGKKSKRRRLAKGEVSPIRNPLWKAIEHATKPCLSAPPHRGRLGGWLFKAAGTERECPTEPPSARNCHTFVTDGPAPRFCTDEEAADRAKNTFITGY